MKSIIILLFMPMLCQAQLLTQSEVNGSTQFEYIHTYDTTYTKDELVNRFFDNIISICKLSANDVTKAGDKVYASCKSNELVWKDIGRDKKGGRFNYTMTVTCKDSKVRILIHNIIYEAGEMVNTKSGSLYDEDYPSNWTKSWMYNKLAKTQWASMKQQYIDDINKVVALIIDTSKAVDDF